jgi:hypothetical protein
MARMQLTGSYISDYPGIVDELKQKDIALRQVRHVDIISKHGWGSEFEVVVTLRDGQTVPLTLTTIVYHPHPAVTMHLNDAVTILHRCVSDIRAMKQLTELDAQELERVAGFLESIAYYEVE